MGCAELLTCGGGGGLLTCATQFPLKDPYEVLTDESGRDGGLSLRAERVYPWYTLGTFGTVGWT